MHLHVALEKDDKHHIMLIKQQREDNERGTYVDRHTTLLGYGNEIWF